MPQPCKIYNVAILVDTSTSWSRELISGILKYTRDHGPWHIHLEPQPKDNKLRLPRNWKGDGIVARIVSNTMAGQLDEVNAKIVNISSIPLRNERWPRVITAAESEAKMAFDALRSRGFRQFAYAGDTRLPYVARLCEAFRTVLAAAGHELHISPSLAPLKLEKWIKSLAKPAAIYCWGTSLGHEIIDICLNAGINVPHDVGVLGSNYDELLSEASHPPQAGIRMASQQIGWTAASILDAMMQGDKPAKMCWSFQPVGVVEKLSIDTMAVSDRRMADAMLYLKKHALEPITVRDLLKANPMARRSMERRFRQLFGCTIIEELHRLRVNHARNLLCDTDDPITLIAEKCCFCSHSYLNRVFKQFTGLSPREYRNQFRNF